MLEEAMSKRRVPSSRSSIQWNSQVHKQKTPVQYDNAGAEVCQDFRGRNRMRTLLGSPKCPAENGDSEFAAASTHSAAREKSQNISIRIKKQRNQVDLLEIYRFARVVGQEKEGSRVTGYFS